MMAKIKKFSLALFLFLLSCTSGTGPDLYAPPDMELIVNVPWNLTEIKPAPANVSLDDMRPFALYFGSDTLLFAHNGCNTFFGPFTIEGDSLKLRGFGSTLIGCPSHDFFDTNALLKTSKITIHNGNLEMSHDDTTLIFTSKFYTPLPETAVLNKTMILVSSNDPQMAYYDSIQSYPTLRLNENRTFTIRREEKTDAGEYGYKANGLFGMNKKGDWTFAFSPPYLFFEGNSKNAGHYSFKDNILKIENRDKGYYYNFQL